MTHQLQRICVFCGSNPGVNGAYLSAGIELGTLLARQGIELVYGGGMTGIMGAVADGVLAENGHVIGVIPSAMNIPRVVHEQLTELIVVETMHQRKALMSSISDAFIALPGGLGTFEELFETLTWSQLGYQPKPIGILNVAGYYEPFLAFIEHAVDEGFVRSQHRQLFTVHSQPDQLLSQLFAFQPPSGDLHAKLNQKG